MNFQDAIQTGFKKYATFSGRASRSEYWFFILFYVIVYMVLGVVDGALFPAAAPVADAAGNVVASKPMAPLSMIWMLILLVPNIAIAARRLHDTNRSGWWQLINFIPLVGWIVFVIFACQKGGALPNRFGLPPVENLTPGA